MKNLSPPSRDLAQRLLSEFSFFDRLIGYRLHPRIGPLEVSLFSFEEAVGQLLQYPGAFHIDLSDLESWIREIVGDGELADRLKEEAETEGGDLLKLVAITRLMVARLIQCRELFSENQT